MPCGERSHDGPAGRRRAQGHARQAERHGRGAFVPGTRDGWTIAGNRAPVSTAAFKGYRDGTHRLVSPRETVERVRPFMARMGITRIADVTGLDSIGIPVVMVVRPNSRSVAVSQGKGLDVWAAKASGLMESVEGYHAEYMTLPLKYCSYAELTRTHRVADVSELPREDPSL